MEHHYEVQVPKGSQVYVESHTHSTNSWGSRHDFNSDFSLPPLFNRIPSCMSTLSPNSRWTVGTKRAQPQGPIFSLFLQLLNKGKRKSEIWAVHSINHIYIYIYTIRNFLIGGELSYTLSKKIYFFSQRNYPEKALLQTAKSRKNYTEILSYPGM